MVPSCVTLNEKTPPKPCLEFAFKRDIEFSFNLPIDGEYKDRKVLLSYPTLVGVTDAMCLAKEVNGESVGVICRGLLSLDAH